MASGSFASTAHWRDSARNARFFLVDARAAFPLFLFLMNIHIWTAIVALASTIFFGIVEYFGFTIPVFLRTIRSALSGSIKSSQPWWK